jgi:SAM-dependent methyltransferase
MLRISLAEGRHAFGNDPSGYAAARPDYPDELYERLAQRCGLRAGTAVFEIGAGTGLATRRLLTLGAAPLRAIEPDPRLAAFLRQTVPHRSLQVDQSTFEEADLPPVSFDLGTAATSFHWLNQVDALAKVRRTLKAGGWWAMWWTHFGADKEYDAFRTATKHLFIDIPRSPSQGRQGRPEFPLDREARLHDLSAAGFQMAEVDLWRWTLRYDTHRLLDLYRTFSPVAMLEPKKRNLLLDELGRVADQQFGGSVERPFITVMYTARRL